MNTHRRPHPAGALLSAIALAAAPAAAAEYALEQDRAAILAMAGTYTVTFDFRENVAIEPGYQFHEPYHATAAEYVGDGTWRHRQLTEDEERR